MSKRLELIWPHKEKVLLRLDEHGKPVWGTKADLEARLLVQLEAVGEVHPDRLDDLYEQGDNLLIKGDNLLALKALERHFVGRIKCIYIDPPFNTGNAFEHYDDGLEHTIWLSLMKARLEILRRLLKDDGVIFVHIDDKEQGNLRCLMDEIFGRRNFVSTLIWESRAGKGGTVGHIAPLHEYIHLYAKDTELAVINKEERVLEASTYEDKKGFYKRELLRQWGQGERREDRPTMYYPIYTPDGRKVLPKLPDGREGRWRIGKKKMEELIAAGDVEFVKQNGEIIAYRKIRKGRVTKSAYGSLLLGLGASATGTAEIKEIFGNKAFDTPKPEKLIKHLIELTAFSGDWVLDSFLGSGTTAAVAHKLGRKWIGIEIGDHAETLCLTRLKGVVKGKDQTGISKQVGWKGGGGFRYCVLGESLFAKDEDTGLVMINPKYTNGPLVAAVCQLEDFRLNDDSLFHGVRGNLYAHITEEKLTQGYVDVLLDRLPEDRALNVYCLKRDYRLSVPEQMKIKRIPKDLRIPRYLRGNGDGNKPGSEPEPLSVPSSGPEKEERPRKDPRRLLEVLRKAQLKGPRDWASNLDRYIYGQ